MAPANYVENYVENGGDDSAKITLAIASALKTSSSAGVKVLSRMLLMALRSVMG